MRIRVEYKIVMLFERQRSQESRLPQSESASSVIPRQADTESPRPVTAPKTGAGRWEIVALALVLLLFASIRWRLRDMPLERDEGEYAYAGQLMLEGVPPYQIAYSMKLPGTDAAYAAMMAVFGETAAGIRTGLLAANAFTILLVYAMGRRLYSSRAGVIAAASYGLLSLEPWVNGFAAHATHFVVLAATPGLLLLMIAIDTRRKWQTLLAGSLLGIAFLMKQPGAAFGAFGLLFLLASVVRAEWKTRDLIQHASSFLLGCLTPLSVTAFVLWRAGVFAKFWFWTVGYAYQYGALENAHRGWHFLAENLSQVFWSPLGILILGGVTVISAAWIRKDRSHPIFLTAFIVFSAIGVSAGFYFRSHYFILLLPALSLGLGAALNSDSKTASDAPGRHPIRWTVVVFVTAVAFALFHERFFFFQADPVAACRYAYPHDPFPEAVEVSRYIAQHSSPSDRIAVLGSEPQIMIYSHRRSVTGYLYAYSLTEEQKYALTMQREEVAEIEAGQPAFVVFAQDWDIRPGSIVPIIPWANQYLSENYDLVGMMQVNDGMRWYTADELPALRGDMIGALYLFRRRPS